MGRPISTLENGSATVISTTRSVLGRVTVAATVVAGTMTVAGCLGGGTGAGGPRIGFGTGDGFREGQAGLPVGDYLTTEYNNLSGLALIGASVAYAAGYTGSGVVVAVVDTGLDVTHSEFADAIHPSSINVVDGSGNLTESSPHGTSVAGIIGAGRDGVGMHGVAFNSTIMAIAAESCVFACGYIDSDLTEATNHAVFHGADIINYSLGGSSIGAGFNGALVNAAGAGVVIVAAAGNDGGANPIEPAGLAPNAGFNGQMIAVGAYDEGTGLLASFSNQAGTAQNFYIVAPGVSVYAPVGGGGFGFVSGTSFSAPFVSGAAAVLMERFPALTAQQIVDILLTTATDLGAAGTDAVYGRGLLNLDSAVQPVGTTSLPTGTMVAEGGEALESTSLSLGAAFGDALANNAVLGSAIFLDGYDRAYIVDLTGSIRHAADDPDLMAFLTSGNDTTWINGAIAPGTTVRMTLTDDRDHGPFAPTLAPENDDEPTRIAVRQGLSASTEFTLAQGYDVGAQFGIAGDAALDGVQLIGMDRLSGPYLGMAGTGGSAVIGVQLGEGLTFRMAAASDDVTLGDRPDDPADNGTAFVAEMVQSTNWGARLGIRLGRLVESDGILNSAGDAAFAMSGTAETDFVGVFAAVPLADGIVLFGGYTTGRTDASSVSTDLLADFSDIDSDSFNVGVVASDVLAGNDRLVLTLARPLRVNDGSAMVDVAVGRTVEGEIIRDSGRASLVPSGAEVDAEVSYTLPIDDRQSIGFNVLTRLEPGHVESADPEVEVGIRYRLGF